MEYACLCGGCICGKCANNVDCIAAEAGEMEIGCFNCEECIGYDGNGTNNKKASCKSFKIANAEAELNRKRWKVIDGSR